METAFKLLSTVGSLGNQSDVSALVNAIIKPRFLSRFAACCVKILFASPNLNHSQQQQQQQQQQQLRVSVLSKLVHICSLPTFSETCVPSGHFKLGLKCDPSQQVSRNWFEVVPSSLREQFARQFVWQGRREFALFWSSVGGPLANTITSFRRATAAFEDADDKRAVFMEDAANVAFVRTRMAAVLFSPDSTARRTIASYLLFND